MKRRSGHQALRKGRVSISGQIYLVTFATQNRRPVFNDFNCACTAAHVLADGQYWSGAKLLCWVLMPDHWHALVELKDAPNLSACVSRSKSISAFRCNQFLGRRGPFWQPAFHDHALRKEEDMVQTARYIVANPLRAGLVRRLGQYPFWNAIWL